MPNSHRLLKPLALPVLFASGMACKGPKITPAQSNADLNQAVARVDDVVVTVGDLQERINKLPPFQRSRYTTLPKKKEFLDNILRFEVMAREAQRRGFDRDPEVVRVMKQQMIQKFLQKDFEPTIRVEDVPEVEVEKYYKENSAEFNRSDEARVSMIQTKDEAKAKKAAAEAKAAPKADQKAFRDLVTKYSEDEDSKARGGDLTFFDKNSTMYPKSIVEASFALNEIGDVSAPVKSDKGWHVLKLTQRRPGFSKPLGEVKQQIQQRLFSQHKTKAMDNFVSDMRKRIKVEIYEDKLGKVLIDTGMQTSGEQPPGSPASAGIPTARPGPALSPPAPGVAGSPATVSVPPAGAAVSPAPPPVQPVRPVHKPFSSEPVGPNAAQGKAP